uniref:Calreticulin n=1 Tax=Trichuris muris TaxID=70415 RepID=A0A5S6Q8E2_TRIMR
MRFCLIVLIALPTLVPVSPRVYLDERFDDGDLWKERWVQSKHEPQQGRVQVSHGDFYAHPEIDKGLQPMDSFRYYQIARKLDVPFNTLGKSLVLQYSVKNQRQINCAGAYIKLLPTTTNLSEFSSKTPYYIMFGPDICGIELRVVRAIIRHEGKEYALKKSVTCEEDAYTHFYSFIIHPNQTYEIRIDNKVRMAGNIIDDFGLHIPYMIRNYKVRKPSDWDDRIFLKNKSMPLNDNKNSNEDAITNQERMYDDGNYNGDSEFSERPPHGYVRNQNYRGRWKPPYVIRRSGEEKALQLAYRNIGAVGFDLWVITTEIVFDNILISDDTNHALKFDEESFERLRKSEKIMKGRMDAEYRIKSNIAHRRKMEKRRNAEMEKHRQLVEAINAEISTMSDNQAPESTRDYTAQEDVKIEL